MPRKQSAERLRYRISIATDSPLYERLSAMSESHAKDWLLTAAHLLHHLSSSHSNGQVPNFSHMPTLDSQREKKLNEKAHPDQHSVQSVVAVSADSTIAPEKSTTPTMLIKRKVNLNGVIAQVKAAYKPSEWGAHFLRSLSHILSGLQLRRQPTELDLIWRLKGRSIVDGRDSCKARWIRSGL